MRQSYTKKELQSIVDFYPGLGTLIRYKLFVSGFENSNYWISTAAGNFVLKVFEGLDINKNCILHEIDIMSQLHQLGIKSPRILSNSEGNLYTPFQSKIAIVMNYIEGENMEKHSISDVLAASIGDEVGKMDLALERLPDHGKSRQNYEFDLKNFLDLKTKIKKLNSEIDQKMIDKIFVEFRQIKPIFDTCPKGLIHNDIVLHNILANGDELRGIIDFSDMVFSPYVQNIAVAFAQLFFMYNWRPHQAKLFLNNYARHRPISIKEKQLLWILIRARFASIIIEFNDWNVTYGADSQREGLIKDTYRFLQSFNALTKETFNSLITEKL